MKLRRLLLLVGVGVLGAIALRSRADRPATEIAIDDGDGRLADDPAEESADERRDLESLDGVGPAYATRLRDAGVADVASLADADVDVIAEQTGIGAARIRGWQGQVGDG